MDSFFKAAVCDLDQLLDEFELHTDELDCKSVYLKPPSYPYSSPSPTSSSSSSRGSSQQCYSSSSSEVAQKLLPDLSALHYDSALRCSSSSSSSDQYHPPTGSRGEEEEGGGGGGAKGVTGVDLLSSVDCRRPSAKCSSSSAAPPCPDRALKPVCDLVSDASSAMMLVNSGGSSSGRGHDAFGELDVAERRMEEQEEEELLVDFGSPLVTHTPSEDLGRRGLGAGGLDNDQTSGLLGALLGGLDSLEPAGGYGASSLSLLDVILPAAAERGSGAEPPLPQSAARSAEREAEEEEDHRQRKSAVRLVADNARDGFAAARHKEPCKEDEPRGRDGGEKSPPATPPPRDPSSSASEVGGGLSCLPMAAASMCGALVNGRTPRGGGDDDDDDECALTAPASVDSPSPAAPPAAREDPDTSSSKTLAANATGSSGSGVVVSTDGSVVGEALVVSRAQNVARSSRPADGAVSPAAEQQQQQLCPEPPAFDVVVASLASQQQHRRLSDAPPVVPKSNPSSSSSEFAFDYLPESERAELLVTDEELDAFLRAHAEEAERAGDGFLYQSGGLLSGRWSQDEGFSEGNGDLEPYPEERPAQEEEPKSCVEAGRRRRREEEEREGPTAAPAEEGEESHESASAAAEEGSCLNPAAASLSSQDPCCGGGGGPYPASSSPATRSQSDTSSPTRSPQQHLLLHGGGGGGGPESHSSYGGARPKQTHCQAPRSPPTAGEEEEQQRTPPGGDSLKDPDEEEEKRLSSSSSPPNPGGPGFGGEEEEEEERLGGSEPPAYCPPQQERYEDAAPYDELSDPPPYHAGPPPPEGERAGGTEEVDGLGCKQPNWVPDAEAPNCMNCWQRFTFTRRRHHCRACGKVYCAVCCNRKCKLKYLEKEARVCITCFDTIHRAQALERMMSPTSGPGPNPNVPSEYCSTVPPLQQARAAGTLNSPPPTVMVPVSVLKQPSNDSCPREQKRVWFADGILPNGEVADTTKLTLNAGRRGPQDADPHASGSEGGAEDALSASEACGAAETAVRPLVSGPWDFALLCGVGPSVRKTPSLLPDSEEELPPLLITTGEEGPGDVLVEEGPAPCQILLLLEEGGPRPLTFVINANLLVHVKLVTYCSRRCWSLVSCGLQALGQRELVFVLECLPEEKTLPKDLFALYLNIYQDAQKGKFIEALGNVTFTSSFLGSREHGGMLFFSPSVQPTEGLTLPPQPVLVGLLIQRLEVPWAKVFPLRLLLRLGAEHSVYPTTLVSIRFRRSVYRETGHTIMNLLADLRNYQYSLPAVEGLRIHMEMGHSYIDIPKSRFAEMLKVVNSSNEHVISVGASFSPEADSHLVCFQNDEGNYQTQANSMPGKTRTVTGASFVVFNGALKASSGFIAKSSIVEDGLMVQIPPDTMESLRGALREQTDLHIPCGKNDGGEVRENVTVRWVDWTPPLNTGIKSGVDGRPLDTAHRVRLQQDAEFESEGRTIRCTEVFYELKDAECCLSTVLSSCSVFQSEMAIAACTALTPHLGVLASSGINALCLRVSTQTDMVEYQAGWGGRLLPQRYMNELDGALIPVIHGGSASVPHTAMDMEFVFYITHTLTQI